jgi:hypothetical protein
LAGLTVFAFVTRYTGYSPEKVAQNYVDTIVQTGDGYNAYKNTLVSQNKKVKYGDFIRRVYMRAYINEKDENGKDIPQAAFVGTGSKEEQEAIDAVYGEMYDYYVKLLSIYGWDNYGDMFDSYFSKLREVRQKVYGDEFMNYDYMFGALEANVATYGESLTGVERQIASDNKTILRDESEGAYQKMFGTEQEVEAENIVDGKKQSVKEKKLVYKLTCEVKSCEELSADEVKAYAAEYKERISDVADMAESRAEAFGLEDTEKEKKTLFGKKTVKDTPKTDMIETARKLDCAEAITNVAKAVVEVKDQSGKVVATQELFLAKIGNCWYVDNTNIDTTGLYLALE